MNFNNNIDVYAKKYIKDGYGGGEYKYTYHSTIKAALAPIKTELILAGGRDISYQAIKVFSKTKIDVDDFIIKHGKNSYKKMSFIDYGKVMLYVMEIDR
jgi:predicted nucleic-acid-binding protein